MKKIRTPTLACRPVGTDRRRPISRTKRPPSQAGEMRSFFWRSPYQWRRCSLPSIAGLNVRIGTQISHRELNQAFQPVADVILSAPADKQPEALQKLESLKQEASKGEHANHELTTKLA